MQKQFSRKILERFTNFLKNLRTTKISDKNITFFVLNAIKRTTKLPRPPAATIPLIKLNFDFIVRIFSLKFFIKYLIRIKFFSLTHFIKVRV